MFGLLKLSLWVLLKPAKQVKYFMAFTGYSSNIYNSCVQISKNYNYNSQDPRYSRCSIFLQCWQRCLSCSFWSPTHVLYLLEQAVDKKAHRRSLIFATLGKTNSEQEERWKKVIFALLKIHDCTKQCFILENGMNVHFGTSHVLFTLWP